MSEVLEIAAQMMSLSEQRLAIVSKNIANAKTSGYRSQTLFSDILDGAQAFSVSGYDFDVQSKAAAGRIEATGGQLDFAIAGPGYFQVAGNNINYLTRAGHFARDVEGRLVNGQGLVLQSQRGSDIIVSSGQVEVLADGTVLDNELPVAQIGLFAPASGHELRGVTGALFAADTIDMIGPNTAQIRQGMLETSNVELGEQMLVAMESVRQAETGARIIQTYNTLLGQAISTFGQGGGR